MAGIAGNGNGSKGRSGAQTLVLLSAPLKVRILRSLAEGSKQLAALQRECGLPAQATLRGQLKQLDELGAVDRHRRDRFPGTLDYELTPCGEELLRVAGVLERWLGMAEDEPLALGDDAAKTVIRALTDGWSTTVLRVLAARPLSLTELDQVISSLSYPSVERRLAVLRLVHLIEPKPGNGRGTPYGATEWLRLGMGPLMAAARWEQRHRPEISPPLGRLDFEAVLLLALPLLRLPAEASGACRLGVEIGRGSSGLAGVMVTITGGEVVACTTKLQGHPEAWALGSISSWLNALLDGDVDSLEFGGDGRLVRAVLEDLHGTLLAAPVAQP